MNHWQGLRRISFMSFICLLLVACSSVGPEQEEEAVPEVEAQANPSVEEPGTAVEAAATATEPVSTSRSNPAPAGSEVVIDDMVFVILSSTRPATDLVMAGDQFNNEPEEGQEYVFVELQVTCRLPGDEQCDFSMRGFSFLGSYEITRFLEIFVEGVDGLLKVGDISGGQTLSGIIPFIVPTDETDLMLVNETFFGDTFYLAIE